MKTSSVKQAKASILTINGGSSSIKFALFEAGDLLRRILDGAIERIGQPEATFVVKGLSQADSFSRLVTAPNHTEAVRLLMDWIEVRIQSGELTAVGHRVVHGGPQYFEPQRITPEMVEELHQLQPFDPEHLPEEILLTEAFHRRFPDLPQVACFDTAFHHDLPRVAQLLPIPRRYEAQGVRRYGFHGLSYAFLMEELARLAGSEAAPRPSYSRSPRQRRQPGCGLRGQIHGYKHGTHAGRRRANEHSLRRSRSWTGLVSGTNRKDESETIQRDDQFPVRLAGRF